MASKSKKKSTWTDRHKLNFKIKKPSGIHLSPGETVALAEIYEKDLDVLKGTGEDIDVALKATVREWDMSRALTKSRSARSDAIGVYKRTKDPITKREWARRVVVANQVIEDLLGVKKRSSATRQRLTMLKGDLELQLAAAEAKAAEARAYAEAGQKLQLVGEKLIDARTRAKRGAIEYSNLEINMEAAERTVAGMDDEELGKQAQLIAEGKGAVIDLEEAWDDSEDLEEDY